MIRKRLFILMMIILAAGWPAPARAQVLNAVSNSVLESGQPETAEPVEAASPRVIKTTLDTLDVQGMDIKEVLKRIAFQSGLEIVTDEDISARVTIYLKNVDVFDALRIILDTNNLAYSQDVSPAGEPAGSPADEQTTVVRVMTARSFESRFGYPFSQKIQTRIIPLVHARAEGVGALLDKMKSEAGKVIYSEGTKSFILIDAPAQLASMSDLIREMDVPAESRTFELRHVKAKDMAPRIQEFLTRNVGRIQFGERETTLTVEDTPEKLLEIAMHVEELDKPAAEVLLEVKVLQIILNDENRQGVDWEAIVSGYQSLPFTGFDGQVPASSAGTTLSVGTVSEEDYMVLLDALDTVGMLNTVSNLKMTAGEEGHNEILIRAQDLLADFEPREPQEGMTARAQVLYGVGSSLGDDEQIMLNIQPQVLGEAAGEKKELTLKLQEGTTVVIGGLFKSVRVEATRKIPLLGDLPLLGFAFRMQGQRLRETEIIVFLTPKVIVKEK